MDNNIELLEEDENLQPPIKISNNSSNEEGQKLEDKVSTNEEKQNQQRKDTITSSISH